MTATTEKFPWTVMSTIGFTVFALVTSEFLPTGMLPSMAVDLGVSTSQIGFLVSVWAATVVVTAIPMSFATRRFSRKSLLITAVTLFTVSNVGAVLTTSYDVLLASRVVGGVGNAMFWMIATGYITTLLPPTLRSRGFLFISGGANFAFIAGLPLGSALAAVTDWRSAFLIMTALTLGASVGLFFLLTPVPNPHTEPGPDARSPLADRTFPIVVLAVAGVFLVVGRNIFYPYIAPFLIEVAGFTPLTLALPLAAYGIGGSVGIFLAERIGRKPELLSRNIAWAVVYMSAMMALVNVAAQSPLLMTVSLALWSLGFSIVEPLYGQYIMEVASPRLRDFAGAMRTTAWNLGIGGGSFVGGLLIVPLGVATLPYLGAVILVCAATMTLVVRGRERALTN